MSPLHIYSFLPESCSPSLQDFAGHPGSGLLTSTSDPGPRAGQQNSATGLGLWEVVRLPVSLAVSPGQEEGWGRGLSCPWALQPHSSGEFLPGRPWPRGCGEKHFPTCRQEPFHLPPQCPGPLVLVPVAHLGAKVHTTPWFPAISSSQTQKSSGSPLMWQAGVWTVPAP